jgi:murein DD-endopeptidase MepM/ murein hydrolase activator NlpD
MTRRRTTFRLTMTGAVLAVLAGCDGGIDFDNIGPGLSRPGQPVRVETEPRPVPDARGVISYPTYQVAVANRGDTVAEVAARIGLQPAELARHNGLPESYVLRQGELLALPRRVADSGPARSGGLSIESIAAEAIDRSAGTPPRRVESDAATGAEPVRHQVQRGETAFSIARLYNVSVRSLADWNGLGPDLAVREGQYLLIPVAAEEPARVAVAPPQDAVTRPGQGSPTPEPPSASSALPENVEQEEAPEQPALETTRTAASAARFAMPLQGDILRGYDKAAGSEGIDIAAAPGTAVAAAGDGTVALVSRSVGQSTILLIRHDDNLYTVYSNVSDVTVEKGAAVSRGQTVARVAGGSPSFLHFEIRRGTESTDPTPFLN